MLHLIRLCVLPPWIRMCSNLFMWFLSRKELDRVCSMFCLLCLVLIVFHVTISRLILLDVVCSNFQVIWSRILSLWEAKLVRLSGNASSKLNVMNLSLTGVTGTETETVMSGPGTGTGTGIESVTGWSPPGCPTIQLKALDASLSKPPFSSRSTPLPTCPTRHATMRSSRSGCSYQSGSTESASLTSWCETSLLCW